MQVLQLSASPWLRKMLVDAGVVPAFEMQQPRGATRASGHGHTGRADHITHRSTRAAFMERYPEVETILGVSDQPVDLLAKRIDCVIRLGDLTDRRLVGHEVAKVKFVTCAALIYLAKHGTPRTIDDLAAPRAVT